MLQFYFPSPHLYPAEIKSWQDLAPWWQTDKQWWQTDARKLSVWIYVDWRRGSQLAENRWEQEWRRAARAVLKLRVAHWQPINSSSPSIWSLGSGETPFPMQLLCSSCLALNGCERLSCMERRAYGFKLYTPNMLIRTGRRQSSSKPSPVQRLFYMHLFPHVTRWLHRRIKRLFIGGEGLLLHCWTSEATWHENDVSQSKESPSNQKY